MPAYLVLDAQTGAGGTTCAAYRYLNATPTQIGNTFGTSFSGTATSTRPRNLVVQFGGELYAMARDGIYQKDDPTSMTGAWSQVLAFVTPSTTQCRFTGLFPVEVAGQTYLVGIYGNSASAAQWRWVKFDGTTWTQAGSNVASSSMSQIHNAIVYGGVLHLIGMSFSAGMTYDPSSDAFGTTTTPASTQRGGMSLCVFQGRLFGQVIDATGPIYLYEYTAGTWSSFANLSGTTIGAINWEGCHHSLITDGTNMYGIWPASAGGADSGWSVSQISAAFAVTDISTTVLPGALLSTNNGGSYPASGATNDVFLGCYDVDTAPGTVGIVLYFANSSTSGTLLTAYQWNGNASVITQIDIGGNVYHSLPTGYQNNGERIWTAGELDISITARVPVIGGERISFIAYGGGTGHSMKLYFAFDGEPFLLEATLATPVTGGSATFNSGLNQVEGVDGDGATVYTIIWTAPVDGVTIGTRVTRVPQIIL